MKNNPNKLKIHEIPHIYYNDKSKDSFHAAILPGNRTYSINSDLKSRQHIIYLYLLAVLVGAQFVGLMPLHGIRNLHSISFRWLSYRVLISVFYLVIGTVMAYLYMNRLTKVGMTIVNLGTYDTYDYLNKLLKLTIILYLTQVLDFSLCSAY